MSEAVLAGHSCTSDGMIRPIWVVGMGQHMGAKETELVARPSSGNVPHPIGLGVNQGSSKREKGMWQCLLLFEYVGKHDRWRGKRPQGHGGVVQAKVSCARGAANVCDPKGMLAFATL